MIDDPEIPSVGIIPLDARTACYRVWAPEAKRVELVLGTGPETHCLPMEAEPRGYFARRTDLPEPGGRYAFALDGGDPLPDPASRWQPDGINRPSAAWFPDRLAWDEGGWKGIARQDLVFYELHVGTFTPEGTFDAIAPRLDALLDLGITAIELMPVAQFPGSRSWGYDGVFPFAVQNTYGGPEALHRLVETCHRRGMAVFLDVLYNHFGPDGNVFSRFGPYLTDRYKTDWGPAINYDGRRCDPVRAFMIENARAWVRDYRVDGLRLDAADQIYDRGPRSILADISEAAHREAEKMGRPVHLFAETDLNDAPKFLHPADRGGHQLDGHWNDDFHHAAHVVLTGETNGYYADFAAGPAALAKAFERIFVNDGNYSAFRERRHGTPALEFTGDRFVAFTQNHDQIGNRLKSDRYAASLPASSARLAAGLLMLAPRLPLLFMGEEYGETNPFPFFCDFESPDLIKAVREGRKAEFAHFGWDQEQPDPVAAETRARAVLSWSWDDPTRARLRQLYRDLIRLRRESPTLRDFRPARTRLHDGATVFEVIRGGLEPDATPELSIVFNLSGDARPVPAHLSSRPAAFRSYGPGATDMWLGPHEFAIFGSL